MFTDDDRDPTDYAEDYLHLLDVLPAPAVRFDHDGNPGWIEEPKGCRHHLFIDPDIVVTESLKPESTDRGREVGVLKLKEGAPVLLG